MQYTRENTLLRIGSHRHWLESFERDFAAWGDGLSIMEYEERETLLESTEFAATMSYWVLTPKDDPLTSDVLATCEVYSTTCLIVAAGSNGEAVTRRCYNLSGLFTPLKHRGQGLGKLMTELLFERFSSHEPIDLADPLMTPRPLPKTHAEPITYEELGAPLEQDDRAFRDGAVLYGHSIIGGDLYSAHGHTVSPFEVRWDVSEEFHCDSPLPSTTPLREEDLAQIALIDTALVRGQLAHLGPRETTRFAVIPNVEHYRYRVVSSRFHCRLIHDREPTVFGARIAAGAGSFAIWVIDINAEEMQIMRLRAQSPSEVCALVRAAQMEAREWYAQRVVAWNMDEKLLEGTGKELVEREHGLPAIAFLGEGDVSWCLNESYAFTPAP